MHRAAAFALLAHDENFHRDSMLLGIVDVVTGFVFAERMSDLRDAQTWETTVRESLQGYLQGGPGVALESPRCVR